MDFYTKLQSQVALEIDWVYLKKIQYTPKTKSSRNAAFSGDLENLQWLKANDYEFEPYTFNHAAVNGSLENMIWLKNAGCLFDEYTMICFIRSISSICTSFVSIDSGR